MNRGELRAKIKADYPEVNGFWKDAQVNAEIDLAAIQVAFDTECLPADEKINLTADEDEYDLDDLLTDFLGLDIEGGVHYYQDSYWEPLDYKTPDELDEDEVEWRTMDSGDPDYYFTRGSKLVLVGPPDTTITDGLWVYFYQMPVAMTADADDPFNGEGYLKPLHPLICLLVGAAVKKAKEKYTDVKVILEEYASRAEIGYNHVHNKMRGQHFPQTNKMPGYFGSFKTRNR